MNWRVRSIKMLVEIWIILSPCFTVSTVTRWVSFSAFSSLVGISIGITSSVLGLKICLTTVGIKKYKSLIKKRKKKLGKIVLLVKLKLKSIEVIISRALTHSNISQNEFVLINNMLKQYD